MITVDPEFQALIPPLSPEERAGLEAAIVRDGRATVHLVVWWLDDKTILLDGHNRFEICTRLNLPFTTTPAPGWIKTRLDARIWIRSTALDRRNLGPGTRARLAMGNEEDLAEKNRAAKIATLKQNRPAPKEQTSIPAARPVDPEGELPSSEGGLVASTTDPQNSEDRKPNKVETLARETVRQAAASAGMSHPTYTAAKKVVLEGTPELLAAMDRGDVAVSTAAELTALSPEKQREIVANPRAAVAAAKAIRSEKLETKRQERVEKIAEISKGNETLAMPTRYPVILADPPWRYEHVETESRAIENQYPTMELGEICKLPVGDIATEDAVLFLWATSPKLAEAMQVVEAWGFSYRTCMVWVKDKIGMGYYARQQHELLLIATRGNPPVPAPSDRPSSILAGDRTAHSAKPVSGYEAIERMYPSWARVELFCRVPRKGWSVWGNQSGRAA